MSSHGPSPLLRAALIVAGIVTAVPARALAPAGANGAPLITVRVPNQGLLKVGQRLQVVIDVQDPDGDPVTVRAVEPPLGFAFAPRIGVPSPARFTVDWRVEDVERDAGALTFVADDGSAATTVSAPFRLLGGSDLDQRTVLADVTGDGVADVIGYSRRGKYPGNDDGSGGVFVWPGGFGGPLAASPIHLFPLAAGLLSDQTKLEGVHDVTGDGVADIVVVRVTSPQPIEIWRGGGDLASGIPPTFTTEPLGTFLDGNLHFGDVTGDGIDDIVAGAGAGLIVVYAGGATVGPRPSASLSAPCAPGSAPVGFGGDAIYLADVTGDGVLDVLASGSRAEFGGADGGAIYVWHGGGALRGPSSPSATLYAPWGRRSLTALGLGLFGFEVGDVTGDGIADVWDRGGDDLFLWHGGPDLVGRRTAELWLLDTLSAGADTGLLDLDGDGRTDLLAGGQTLRPYWSDVGSRLGSPLPDGSIARPPDLGGFPQSPTFHLADVDVDGLLDVLLGDPGAEDPATGTTNAGAVYVWYGGRSFGPSTPPDATLLSAVPVPDTRLGMTLGVADVTGDGLADVVATAARGAFADTYVWAGEAVRFSGLHDSTAVLRGAGARVRLVDVTGDGLTDVVASASGLAGSSSPGYLSVWRGGADLAGEPAPILAASGNPSEGFTLIPPGFADLDGDDVLDLFTGSARTAVNGVMGAGSISVWRGGVLTPGPTVRIERASPVTNDGLGSVPPAALRDATGDGLVDLVFGGSLIDVGSVANAGALLFLSSGGFPAPIELYVPGAEPEARLGGG